MAKQIKNPFRPGAGHTPPYLAGREHEQTDFRDLLKQDIILKNLILTGLRGIGKTVLLETFKPMAIQAGWLWAGTDLSEASSISEENLAIRILADLSVLTSSIPTHLVARAGFAPQHEIASLDYYALEAYYQSIPGHTADKIKGVLEMAWSYLKETGRKGIVFAYDEAQNLANYAGKDQYPMSMLLDVFQSIQRKDIPFMLALTGLPTLFPKLVEARTFAERMFHVVTLGPLDRTATIDAVNKPIEDAKCPFSISEPSIDTIWSATKGYPYFIQYICRECFDIWTQAHNEGQELSPIPTESIMRKLDSDFYSGRWSRATDRQKALLGVIAMLASASSEFTVLEIIESTSNQSLKKPFTSSTVNQMLSSLTELGLVYKNRHGRYSFAVPLLAFFIKRQAVMLDAS